MFGGESREGEVSVRFMHAVLRFNPHQLRERKLTSQCTRSGRIRNKRQLRPFSISYFTFSRNWSSKEKISLSCEATSLIDFVQLQIS